MQAWNRRLIDHSLWFKLVLHLVLQLPLAYCYYGVFIANSWGGDPVQAIIHYFANTALNILFITLSLSVVAKHFRLSALLRYRRLLGLYVAWYATLHVASYWALDLGFEIRYFIEALIERPYIWLGMASLSLLLLMALSSFKALQRKMGKRWLQLHGLIFPMTPVMLIHFYWSLKSGWVEPLVYALGLACLYYWKRQAIQRWFSSFKRS